MSEFTQIGKHCAAENCNQQDFLPFTCDCCQSKCERERGRESLANALVATRQVDDIMG